MQQINRGVLNGQEFMAINVYTRDGSRLSNIRIFYFIIEYRLGCAIIF